MVNCSVKGCSSQSSKPKLDHRLVNLGISKNVSFLSFPSNNAQREIWIRALKVSGKLDCNWRANLKYAKICGLHFNPSDIAKIHKGKNRRDHLVPNMQLEEIKPENVWQVWRESFANISPPQNIMLTTTVFQHTAMNFGKRKVASHSLMINGLEESVRRLSCKEDELQMIMKELEDATKPSSRMGRRASSRKDTYPSISADLLLDIISTPNITAEDVFTELNA